MTKGIEVDAVIILASKGEVRTHWDIKARVVRADGPKVSVEQDHWLSMNRLVGTLVNLHYAGPIMKNLSIRSGILFRMSLPVEAVEVALSDIVEGMEPTIMVTSSEIIRPMAEPCVRVPLSVLRELRGQEAGIESTRRALVKTWSQDRRTGNAAGK